MTDQLSLERLRSALLDLMPEDATFGSNDDLTRLRRALADAWAKGFHLGAKCMSDSAIAASASCEECGPVVRGLSVAPITDPRSLPVRWAFEDGAEAMQQDIVRAFQTLATYAPPMEQPLVLNLAALAGTVKLPRYSSEKRPQTSDAKGDA
jgi:hypothetical protein